MVSQAVALSLREQTILFDPGELSLTADRFKRELTGQSHTWLDKLFTAPPQHLPSLAPQQIQLFVDRFADHICKDAWGDLGKYFSHAGIPLTPGGLPTGSLALNYPRKGCLPNLLSLSALGEAVAGWYLLRKGMMDIARPVGTTIDILFQRPPTDGRWCLVSAKSSISANGLKAEMVEGACDLLKEIAAAKYQMKTPFVAYCVGVHFVAPDNFVVYSLELEEQ